MGRAAGRQKAKQPVHARWSTGRGFLSNTQLLEGSTLRGRQKGRERPACKETSAAILGIHGHSLSSHGCGGSSLTTSGAWSPCLLRDSRLAAANSPYGSRTAKASNAGCPVNEMFGAYSPQKTIVVSLNSNLTGHPVYRRDSH